MTIIYRVLSKLRILRNYSYHDVAMPNRSMIPVFADIGDLVISNQSGIHRGLPQKSGYSRYVIVDNFKNLSLEND